jgi:hypothetical protein
MVVLTVLFSVPATAGETHCFNSECFEVNKAEGVLIGGFNLPQGEYKVLTETIKNGSSSTSSYDLDVMPNSMIRIRHEIFNFTMNMDTGKIKSYTINAKINNKMKKAFKNGMDAISDQVRMRGNLGTGDAWTDEMSLPFGPQIGTAEMSVTRRVLGITTYKSKDYAVVNAGGTAKIDKHNIKITFTGLVLHDPETGIAMFAWADMELTQGANTQQVSMEEKTTVTRK